MSEESLGVESQIAQAAHDPSCATAAGGKGLALDAATDARLSPEVMELIEHLLDGTEAYGRDLKSWEMTKFNPIHINICVLKAAGFRGTEISKIVGMEQSNISQVLRHPYGIKLVAALVPRSAVKVFDIRTKLEEYASTLLDEVYKAALTCENIDVQARVTFGLLDRAGFQPKQGDGGLKAPPAAGMSSPTMARLMRAMGESEIVDREVMPGRTPSVPPEEGSPPAGQQAAAGGQR
jgi:hypothetical protein